MTEQTVTYEIRPEDFTMPAPSNGAAFVDNRIQIVVDEKKVETWELLVMETGRITDWLLIFSRYLCRGDNPVSPEIPNKPLDELSKAELAQIHSSQAYKLMKRFSVPQLRQAAEAFQKQLEAGF